MIRSLEKTTNFNKYTSYPSSTTGVHQFYLPLHNKRLRKPREPSNPPEASSTQSRTLYKTYRPVQSVTVTCPCRTFLNSPHHMDERAYTALDLTIATGPYQMHAPSLYERSPAVALLRALRHRLPVAGDVRLQIESQRVSIIAQFITSGFSAYREIAGFLLLAAVSDGKGVMQSYIPSLASGRPVRRPVGSVVSSRRRAIAYGSGGEIRNLL